MANLADVDAVKSHVEEYYRSGKALTINVSIKRPRVELNAVKVYVRGVYPHIFRIETENKENYSLQYIDILTGKIEIIE